MHRYATRLDLELRLVLWAGGSEPSQEDDSTSALASPCPPPPKSKSPSPTLDHPDTLDAAFPYSLDLGDRFPRSWR
ncbi:hypothetical protein NMY22_g19304 [Coprinellus aureogranulatus]|nr:hypothetical protein NMY22_g19304 [Coprinellus aureogranulatus]